jgi:hypothetical protein
VLAGKINCAAKGKYTAKEKNRLKQARQLGGEEEDNLT